MGYARQKTILGFSGVASSSTGTSLPIFVGDSRLLSLSVETASNLSASAVTVSLSDNQGFQSNDSRLFFSVVTILPNRGIFIIDPGARWMQVERGAHAMTSAASNTTVTLNRYYE